MAVSPGIIQFDPSDGIQLRTYFESLRGRLESDRSSWDDQWGQLCAFFAPYSAVWNYSQVNQGERQDFQIINETGLLAARTLAAGMLSGMSSPTSPWLKIGDADPDLNELPDVRAWAETAEERVRKVFLKSNTYQSLLNLYSEEGIYGSSSMMVMEDDKTIIRCQPDPIGSYYLMVDDQLRISGRLRIMNMTVDQIVTRFGYDKVSSAMQVQYTSPSGGNREQRYPIVNVVLKGAYFGKKDELFDYPWTSSWYEMASFNEKMGVLRRSGFLENPLIVGRWKVTGENVYGFSAGMDCLGSVMSLQAWEERTARGTEMQFNPPTVASTVLDARKATLLPGEMLWADTNDVSNLMKPAYGVTFQIDGALAQIQRLEGRINDAMYRSLFQMISESDRRDVTAEEIRAKQQEKMQVLGPVVERNVEEVLAPLVMRTLSIMQRRGMLPAMPDALKGRRLQLEFESILARAQKIGEFANLQTFMGFVGNEVAVDQGILDNVDLDEATRVAAKITGVPSKVLRSPEDVAAMRQDRARQQQMAQAADNAQKLAGAAQNLAATPTGTGSLLDQALPALTRGAA